jgi:hypothetical protein
VSYKIRHKAKEKKRFLGINYEMKNTMIVRSIQMPSAMKTDSGIIFYGKLIGISYYVIFALST